MELSDNQFKANVYDYDVGEIKINRPTVVELFTDWCGICKTLSPALDSLAQKFTGAIDIVKVNITRSDDLTKALNIQSVPTFLFFKPNSETNHTITGVSSISNIEKAITNYFYKEAI